MLDVITPPPSDETKASNLIVSKYYPITLLYP